MIKKCKYYNNHHTCCTLMLDDFSLTATTINGEITPSNDWGYGLDEKGSLFNYLESTIFQKFPEIKGTFFFPVGLHAAQNKNSGYQILQRSNDKDLKAFFKRHSCNFDVAFHGITHGKYIKPEASFQNWENEFEYFTLEDVYFLKEKISESESLLEIKFSGGKYPGYKKNIFAEDIIESLGFKWWSSNCKMMNRKHKSNKHGYLKSSVLDFPTNIGGGCFKTNLRKYSKLKNKLKLLINNVLMENYLQYLYENQLIISIQEHIQNLRTDGNRQTPNIYDDINSLDRFYGILRGADIWYDTCNNIAHYLESYDFSEIIETDDDSFEIKYSGKYDELFLSISSDKNSIKNLNNGREILGVYKQGEWIFNNIHPGKYQL